MTTTPFPQNLEKYVEADASWNARPFQIVTLLKMLEFSAVKYVEMVIALERLTSIFNVDVDVHTPLVTGEGKERITAPLNSFIGNCDDMELRATASYAREIVEKIESSVGVIESVMSKSGSSLMPQELNTEIGSLRRIFNTELAVYAFMTVLPAKQDYYNQPLDLFWVDSPTRYDSAAIDLENAGKCFALNRNTACVFHLMRVMETGLRLLVTSLGYALPKYNRSWHVILHRHLKDLHEEKPANRSPEWNANPEFYAEAAARLLAVKDAWRNKTMHVEVNYDDDQAKDIWNHVSGFIRHLAKTIPE